MANQRDERARALVKGGGELSVIFHLKRTDDDDVIDMTE